MKLHCCPTKVGRPRQPSGAGVPLGSRQLLHVEIPTRGSAMRWIRWIACGVGIWLIFAGQARAGLYNTEEPLPFLPAMSIAQFQLVLDLCQSVAPAPMGVPPSPRRQHYLQQVIDLETKDR